MKLFTRLMALALALLLCVPALAATNDDVLATVNGSAVTRGEYQACLTELEDEYAAYGYDVTDPSFASVLQLLALQTAVEYELLGVKQVELGLQLTDAERADAAQMAREDFYLQVDMIVDQYGYYGLADISTDEGRAAVMLQVLSQLEAEGVTEASYIAQALVNAGYDKVYAYAVQGAAVTDAEVRAQYDSLVESDRVSFANDVASYEYMLQSNQDALIYGMPEYYVDLYYVPAGYRYVMQIVLMADDALLADYTAIKADPGATAAEIARAEAAVLASAQMDVAEINARLQAGESFADLAYEYSIADVVTFDVHPQSTRYDVALRDAAFTVSNVGDVTAPVVTNQGVHILCYMGDVPAGPVAYTHDVQALLHETLLTSRQQNLFQQTMNTWMSEATIVYSDEAEAILNAY